MKSRIADARAQTVRLLDKALSYSPEFRKPAQISFYQAHIAYLDALANGQSAEKPKADLESWDVMQLENR